MVQNSVTRWLKHWLNICPFTNLSDLNNENLPNRVKIENIN